MTNRNLRRAGRVGLCASILLSAACQPASDLPREGVPADSTEPPPPPPPLPGRAPGDTLPYADSAAEPPAAVTTPDTAVAAAPLPPVPPPPPPATSADCRVAATARAPGQLQVQVYFTCGEEPRPVPRTVPTTRAVLRTALDQLLRGPTAEERAAGFHSFFGDATAGAVNSVVVSQDGTARIDFDDFSRAIPNASSSAGSAMLLAELGATIFQYPGVRAAEITFEGSRDRFWNWLQRGCMQLAREG